MGLKGGSEGFSCNPKEARKGSGVRAGESVLEGGTACTEAWVSARAGVFQEQKVDMAKGSDVVGSGAGHKS